MYTHPCENVKEISQCSEIHVCCTASAHSCACCSAARVRLLLQLAASYYAYMHLGVVPPGTVEAPKSSIYIAAYVYRAAPAPLEKCPRVPYWGCCCLQGVISFTAIVPVARSAQPIDLQGQPARLARSS